ncbi:MAG: hypothetical protein IJ719_06015 [Clostridia bacterium]|nr:hypothetical protein [Clostridia bacterium]
MARPRDPHTGYRMKPHKVGTYTYASTQREITDENGVRRRKYFDWGKLDENNRFFPLARFLYLGPDEQAKFIFPDDWDISKIKEAQIPAPAPVEDAVMEVEQTISLVQSSRFYGGIWLLERIAEEAGLREDLMTVFFNNQVIVDDIMSVSMFLCLTSYNVDRLEDWQELEKYPSTRTLSPPVITELEKSITYQHKMDLFQCRALRVQNEEVLAVDSSTKTSFNGKLINVAWGMNKEGLHLPVTLEVTVYSMKQHIPVYTTTLQGNMNDSRSVDIIIADLKEMKLNNYVLIMDRAYATLKNLKKYILNDIRIIACMKVNTGFALGEIKKLGNFSFIPDGFTYSEELDLYVRQFDIAYSAKNDDKTQKMADRLKLNLYFDPEGRARTLKALDLGKNPQREELEKAIQKHDSYYDLHKKAIEDQYNLFELEWQPIKVPIEECPEILKAMKDEPKKRGRKPKYVTKYVLIGYKRNDAALIETKKTAGFRAIITLGQDLDAVQAMLHYGIRDEQEKDHEAWKTQLSCDRERNSSEKAALGASFIQFVGRIMYDMLRYKWKSSIPMRKAFRSTLQLLDEMRKIKCYEFPNQSKLMITPFVGNQLTACELLHLPVPNGCAP